MQVEITNANYGTKTVKVYGTSVVVKTGTAVARVTINGETREFAAELAMNSPGFELWRTADGMAAVYPTGDKVHNVGADIFVDARGTGFDIRAGRSSMRARRNPRCVGFFNDCANAAIPRYRR